MTGRMQVLQWIIVGRMLQVLSCNFANVWYLVFNVWCVMCDFDVQCLVFDVQCFECGRRECESLWMGLCIGDGVENLFDESVGWGGLRKGSWQNSFKGRHKEKLWKTAVWGVGGSPPPSLTASICEDFDPFLSYIKLQNNPKYGNFIMEIFTFTWPLQGRGGGVNPSGQPDHFFSFFF